MTDDPRPREQYGLTPVERSLRAKIAANTRWSKSGARGQQSTAAREALWRRFEKQVDPDGVLPDEQRRQLAESAAKAHSAQMNLAKARKDGTT